MTPPNVDPVSWTDQDLGRAFREAVSTAAASGFSKPSLMGIVEGYEASAHRPSSARRFRAAVRVVHRSPEMALWLLADKMREAAA